MDPTAFPNYRSTKTNGNGAILAASYSDGMSLREWYAGHAPPAPEEWVDNIRHVQSARYHEDNSYKILGVEEIMALWSFKYADAMMVERLKGENKQ